jgi:hypothetical protein
MMSEFSILMSIIVLVSAGVVLGEMLAATGVFKGKTDFALFFLSLAGFFIWDFLSLAAGFNMAVPVGVVMWGAFLSLAIREEVLVSPVPSDSNESS